jgi:hypothetical protein
MGQKPEGLHISRALPAERPVDAIEHGIKNGFSGCSGFPRSRASVANERLRVAIDSGAGIP